MNQTKIKLITTNVNGALYTHLPDRDLAKDLKKAQRKWDSKPRAQQTPVLHASARGELSLIDRTINRYRNRLHALTDPLEVVVITLFKPTRPMTWKFNAEIKAWANSGSTLNGARIHIRYVDPADWGLE
jgi:hypothetical protein